MVKENQHIEIVSQSDLKDYDSIHFISCIIDTIDLIGVFELKVSLTIEGCIINNLKIHSCWFTNGVVLINNLVKNYVDYQMGGHNRKPMLFEGNVFSGFFNFFDCQFEDVVELRNNIFIKGTNLLGNRGEGYENSFSKGFVVENNLGIVDADRVDG